ncbi:HAD-IA family hydrolase [Pendulispora brunnea]|uniref:HAD-IA family hydrolase n=1 Tax=Pendulispora brunnea TaxID=2905690 RepID=A0ABZ2KJF5_9BACT
MTRLTADALLFDMDGTLVDSTVVVERTWRRFAARFGLAPEAILATSHGRRTGETVAQHAPPGVDLAKETARLEAEEVADVEGIVAVPGAAELLAKLPANRWAIVTSAGRELAARRMAAASLPMPEVVITAEDVARGKPHPEGYLSAAAALSVSASSTIIFEDAEAGLLAARATGAEVVVVGHHDGHVTAGLRRVHDLRGVSVSTCPNGMFELVFPSASPPST